MAAMSTTLELDSMSVEEKLEAMEALWADLGGAEAIPVYDWQRELLDERERMIEEGSAKFSDWEEAKERITKITS
jgi:hypothetical protein